MGPDKPIQAFAAMNDALYGQLYSTCGFGYLSQHSTAVINIFNAVTVSQISLSAI
jgi:hypothetical protein